MFQEDIPGLNGRFVLPLRLTETFRMFCSPAPVPGFLWALLEGELVDKRYVLGMACLCVCVCVHVCARARDDLF